MYVSDRLYARLARLIEEVGTPAEKALSLPVVVRKLVEEAILIAEETRTMDIYEEAPEDAQKPEA